MWRKHPKGDKSAIFHFFIVALLIWLIMGGVGPVSGASMAWKFRSDLSNSGNYDDGGLQPDGVLLWSYPTGNVVHSSPAIVNDVVYVGSGDGNLYALDAGTGTLLWNYTTGNFVYSSPAIVNDVVYVGSSDDSLYALDAAMGTLLWSYSTGSDIESSPSVTNGMVYVGSDDHNLYALDAGTGTLLWNYTTGNSVETSPVVVNGVAMVGSADRTLYALNATIGSLVWKFTTGGVIHSSPAVANGIVYIGSDDYNLYALNMATGTLLWNYTTGNYVDSSPAIASGIVYVGSADRNLYALDAEMGTLLWKYRTGGQVDSSPAIANGIAYVGSNDNNLYALDAATGTLLWNYTTSSKVDSSPAVVDGIVYFGSSDGTIYALGVSPDTPPPGITNLRNTTYQQNLITWNWTDPVSADFDHVMVYLEGVFQENVTAGNQTFTATALSPSTSYIIGTRTVGTTGLINQTWVNNTATTAPSQSGPIFTIILNGGWNIFSTPIRLGQGHSQFSQVFSETEAEKLLVILGWDGVQWYIPGESDELKPLDAYYIKVKDGMTATGAIVPSRSVTNPPERQVQVGYNLIGNAPAYDPGLQDFPAMPLTEALVSIEYAGNKTGYLIVVSPGLNQPAWSYVKGDTPQDLLPYKGYWVYMENPGTLAGFSVTPIQG